MLNIRGIPMAALGLLSMMQKYKFIREAVEKWLSHRNLEVGIRRHMHHHFDIHHTTLQIERSNIRGLCHNETTNGQGAYRTASSGRLL